MVGEGRVEDVEGGASNGNLWVDLEGKEICRNGFVVSGENGALGDVYPSGSLGNVLIKYKRRKRAKTVEDGKLDMASTSQGNHQSTKELWYKNLNRSSYLQARLTQKDLHACTNDAKGCSAGHIRNVVLEKMSQMLEYEGGFRGCIQDAVAYHRQSCMTTEVKGSVHSCENLSKCTSQTCPTLNKLQNGICGNEGMVFNRPMQEPNCYPGKEICQRTFNEVISSEKFAELCHLLLKSFPGVNSERVLDISFMDSKMEEGAYENSPNLFHADIQQVWTKIEKIGTDMVALAKSLSAISRTSFYKQSGSEVLCSTEAGTRDEPDMHGKEDWIQSCDVYMVCTCKNCGEKADARNSLVCDSCEEMFHVACIEPSIEEIPESSWYCASCTANGMGSPHDDCVVCERMNAPISLNHGGACRESKNVEGMVVELEESSYDLSVDELTYGGGDFPTCIICRSVVVAGEKLKICRHGFCPHKFYHVNCLASNQLKTYALQWYCPSCLCRYCLTDCDDNKIVLCDGCDHAYHIYCMHPPRTSVPERKWFCRKCEADVRLIHQAKISYEIQHQELKKTASGGNEFLNGERTEETVTDAEDKKPGGMNILPNAVKTLNNEDGIAT